MQETEDTTVGDQPNKALPALTILKDLLGEKYVFHEQSQFASWNENELEQPVKKRIVLPMADAVSRSLLAALEQTFGPKAQVQDPKRAVKKFWPGPWAKVPTKIPFNQKVVPFSWTGRYFAELGLRMPHPHQLPKTASCPRSLREVELQVQQLQKGIRASNAVEVTLQGLQALLDSPASDEAKVKQMRTLLRFGRYANFYAMGVPLSIVVQDTALVRESVLADLKITQNDTGYAELMRAPYINSTLFPGCSRKLERILGRRRRAHSFYSRVYRPKQSQASQRAPRNKPFVPPKFRKNQGGRQDNRYRAQNRRGDFRPNQRRQQQGPSTPPVKPNKYVSGKQSAAPAAFSAVPTLLLNAIRAREAEQVGACLLGLQSQWAARGASQWMQNLISFGYAPTLLAAPPLTVHPPFAVHSRDKQARLDDIVQQLLLKRVVEVVQDPASSPGMYSYLFLRPKKTGGFRPVFNMKPLNKFVQSESFQMETPLRVAASIRPGSWACSLDLADAYLHIPMHQSVCHLLRFTNGRVAYQFRALPFGLNVSAWVFTKATSVAVAALHSQGVAVSAYIDDWLVHHDDRLQVLQHRDDTIRCLLDLGWHVNEAKSEFHPAQQFLYLGVAFDTLTMTMALPAQKIAQLQSALTAVFASASTTPRALRSLIGLLSFAMHYVPFGKANTRPFQWLLKRIWDWSEAALDVPVSVPFVLGLRAARSRWADARWAAQGVPMHRSIQAFTLHTDASGAGWGASLSALDNSPPVSFAGVWSLAELSAHSNEKELAAVEKALRQAALRNVLVQVYSDNTTTVAVLNRQGTVRSWHLQRVAARLFRFLQETNVQVRAAHIPGILNVHADALSRPDKVFATEWALDRAVFRWVCASCNFEPAIDAFATAANAQLPLFFSPVPAEGAAGLDAFNQAWEGWSIYMFPPFVLLPQVIQKLSRSRGTKALLIFPMQPRRPWYPVLMALRHTTPLPLPLRRRLLSQPHNGEVHPRLSILNLHAAVFWGP
jgi:ribonuclease HI